MKKIFSFILVLTFCFSEDFSEGPYGTSFFDIAGPFSVPDLNITIQGDPNFDETVNIQDVIIVVQHILGSSLISGDAFNQGDINNDSIIDILDILAIINQILDPQDPLWNFESQWIGSDSYILVQYDPSVPSSTALWSSNTKEDLLDNSPMNVHYFFISNRSQYETDIEYIKTSFDEVLSTFSNEMQAHWKDHLHFVNARVSEMDNWLDDALSGEYAISIDCFQRIREVGYLGNPATFSGTYLSYLAHEAHYFNYELEVFNSSNETAFDEIAIFDEYTYTGGWASSISQEVTLPSDIELNNYSKLEVELLRGCPDSNGEYSDDGCDDYDRIAHMYLCQGQCFETIYYSDNDETTCIENGYSWDSDNSTCYQNNYLDDITQEDCPEGYWNLNRECHEIARWITPFDRQPHHLTDITPFISSLRPGGTKLFKFQESGWPNSLITLKLRLHNGTPNGGSPKEIIPIWNGTVQFNPNYDDNRPPQVFQVPENAQKVEFVAYITGHGWGSAGCYNCCEFCNSKHIFSVNGGVYEFYRDHPNASSSNYCMQTTTIAQGVIPNQGGTWGYGRAGWCPGMDVHPYITEITDFVNLGEENVIDYSACRVSGNSCVTPPTCNGDGYCPEVAFSSYIIISY